MRLCCTIVAGICAGAEQNEERFDFYLSTFKGIVVETSNEISGGCCCFFFCLFVEIHCLFFLEDVIHFFFCRDPSPFVWRMFFVFCFVHLSRFFAFCPLAMEKRAPWSPLSLPCIAASRAKYSRSFLAMIRRRLDAKRYIQRTKTPWKAT